MFTLRAAGFLLAATGALCALVAQEAPAPSAPPSTPPGKLIVTVGKSLIIDSPVKISRISVANGDLIEAVPVNPKEVLINGKGAGETSLIFWQEGGNRVLYDLTVRNSPARLDVVRQQLARDFPNDEINVTYENETAFVRGTVKDVTAADRVMAMTASLGKSVNLLRVEVPPVETQILLKVRFCDVDRSASRNLGLSLVSGAGNQATGVNSGTTGLTIDPTGAITLANALNVFLFRKDLNLGVAIQAMQAKNQLQTLAEPNVLALNGKQASFISGGEFPVPMIQGGNGNGAVSISWREFGIRIAFLPKITPRGTIQLQVTPEVSALDYANAVTFQGYTIPALSTRRVQTEVELESGQSFVVAGLLDNTLSETISKIPGLASIPLLGQLFTTRTKSRNNTELMVIVTPEVVRPIPAGQPLPELHMPYEFLPRNSDVDVFQPGMDKTGPVPVKPPNSSMPVEQLIELKRKEGQAAPPATVTGPVGPVVPAPASATPPGSGGAGK